MVLSDILSYKKKLYIRDNWNSSFDSPMFGFYTYNGLIAQYIAILYKKK